MNTPTTKGYYLCKVITAEVKGKYRRYSPLLLYWEGNVWITSPKSFTTYSYSTVVDWMPIPNEYNPIEEDLQNESI